MNITKVKSFAKINLALNITGKLTKLHKIESIVKFIKLHDSTELVYSDLNKLVENEVRIDPDIWVVEIEDKKGRNFFLVKNSWGTSNYPEGYLYVSESYFKLKTINIYLHKDGISDVLATKLGL